MRAYRAAGQYLAENFREDRNDPLQSAHTRMFFVGELLSEVRPQVWVELKAAWIKSSGLEIPNNPNYRAVEDSLLQLSAEQLRVVIKDLLKTQLSLFKPYGALTFSPLQATTTLNSPPHIFMQLLKKILETELGLTSIQNYSLYEIHSLFEHTVRQPNWRGRNPSRLVSTLARLIYFLQNLSETKASEWANLVRSTTDLSTDSPYYKVICGMDYFLPIIQHAFCPQ